MDDVRSTTTQQQSLHPRLQDMRPPASKGPDSIHKAIQAARETETETDESNGGGEEH